MLRNAEVCLLPTVAGGVTSGVVASPATPRGGRFAPFLLPPGRHDPL